MFFWLDFSSGLSSIASVVGLCLAAFAVWLLVYIVYRLFRDNRVHHPARAGNAALDPGVGAIPYPQGFIGRLTVSLGTALGLLFSRGPNANNRRAKVLLGLLMLSTLVFAFGYLPYAYNHAHPNGLRNAVLTETFGQQPLSNESMTRAARIPNPDEFYGTQKPANKVTAERPATSILWLCFWMLVFFPLAWACLILYAVISLREETWNGMRSMVARVRDWVSNLSESGIRGTRSAGGAQGGITFGTPVVITSGGAATVAEAEKEKMGVPWAKLLQWFKRNSGEVVAALFVVDELLEVGLRRKHRNNTNNS